MEKITKCFYVLAICFLVCSCNNNIFENPLPANLNQEEEYQALNGVWQVKDQKNSYLYITSKNKIVQVLVFGEQRNKSIFQFIGNLSNVGEEKFCSLKLSDKTGKNLPKINFFIARYSFRNPNLIELQTLNNMNLIEQEIKSGNLQGKLTKEFNQTSQKTEKRIIVTDSSISLLKYLKDSKNKNDLFSRPYITLIRLVPAEGEHRVPIADK